MAIVRWDPFGEMTRMQRDMDRIFSRMGQGQGQGGGGEMAWMPKIDVKRAGDDVVVRAELPGMRPEDVDVELQDNILTISGERKQEEQRENEGWLIQESNYGSFERSLSIPEGVDAGAISANFDNGVLEVRVPQAFKQMEPQRTRIQIGGQTQMQMGEAQGQQQGQKQMGGQQQGQGMSSGPEMSGRSEQGMTQEQMQKDQERQKVGSGQQGSGQGGQQ